MTEEVLISGKKKKNFSVKAANNVDVVKLMFEPHSFSFESRLTY